MIEFIVIGSLLLLTLVFIGRELYCLDIYLTEEHLRLRILETDVYNLNADVSTIKNGGENKPAVDEEFKKWRPEQLHRRLYTKEEEEEWKKELEMKWKHL